MPQRANLLLLSFFLCVLQMLTISANESEIPRDFFYIYNDDKVNDFLISYFDTCSHPIKIRWFQRTNWSTHTKFLTVEKKGVHIISRHRNLLSVIDHFVQLLSNTCHEPNEAYNCKWAQASKLIWKKTDTHKQQQTKMRQRCENYFRHCPYVWLRWRTFTASQRFWLRVSVSPFAGSVQFSSYF